MADSTSAAPCIRPAELVGAWELVAFHELADEGGATAEGPLGAAPEGILIYQPDGAVSVSMMRPPDAGTPDSPPTTVYMGYAGTWRLEGARVLHHVEVSTHTYQLGRDLEREARLREDLLELVGRAGGQDRHRRRVLTWRRRAPEVPRAVPDAPPGTGGSA